MSKSLNELIHQASQVEVQLIQNNGELTPTLENMLIINEKELSEKLDNYDFTIDRLRTTVDLLRIKEEKINRARAALENFADRLESNIKNAMMTMQVSKLDGEDVSFVLSKSKPSVVITNETLVPQEYKVTKTTEQIKKDKLREDLALGIKVDGCELKETFSLKRNIKK
jgi:hypothetical protein